MLHGGPSTFSPRLTVSPPFPAHVISSSYFRSFNHLGSTCERTEWSAPRARNLGPTSAGVQRFMKHLQTCSACKQPGLTTNCRRQKSYYEETGESQLLDFAVFRASSCAHHPLPFPLRFSCLIGSRTVARWRRNPLYARVSVSVESEEISRACI